MLEEMKLTEAELREHITADLRWGKFAENARNDKSSQGSIRRRKSIFLTAASSTPATSW